MSDSTQLDRPTKLDPPVVLEYPSGVTDVIEAVGFDLERLRPVAYTYLTRTVGGLPELVEYDPPNQVAPTRAGLVIRREGAAPLILWNDGSREVL